MTKVNGRGVDTMVNIEKLASDWSPVEVPEQIPHGDMPGDKVCIGAQHVAKAETVFRALKDMLHAQLAHSANGRAVLCVYGGSGVGKSEIASVLGYYLNGLGIGAYILSGDNYPHRVPRDNDAERLRVYRTGGLRGLIDSGLYTDGMGQTLRALWESDQDADAATVQRYPWMQAYHKAGYGALARYLGTPRETDFDEVNGIIARFKGGASHIPLKRMGRERTELWYDTVDMSDTGVLIIEWTHGNSEFLEGVDIPILLNSTPAQTLAHRRARNRDGQTDSAFTAMVLDIEQKKLESQAWKAKIIISKEGERLDHKAYRLEMAQE